MAATATTKGAISPAKFMSVLRASKRPLVKLFVVFKGLRPLIFLGALNSYNLSRQFVGAARPKRRSNIFRGIRTSASQLLLEGGVALTHLDVVRGKRARAEIVAVGGDVLIGAVLRACQPNPRPGVRRIDFRGAAEGLSCSLIVVRAQVERTQAKEVVVGWLVLDHLHQGRAGLVGLARG